MITPYSDELLAALQEILDPHPEAVKFIYAFHDYAHRIDDIIDEKIQDPEYIIKTFALAEALYSSKFYQTYLDQLYPIVKLISNTYADSVMLEKGSEPWQLHQADVLRHVGNEMLVAIVDIFGTYEQKRKISLLIRGHAFHAHHTKEGRPI